MTQPYPHLPDLVLHADWSVNQHKRWMAMATRQENGHYLASTPVNVADAADFLNNLTSGLFPRGMLFIGFDFPIGLPKKYAQRAGIDDFLSQLPQFGHGRWKNFYQVAEQPGQICLEQPFYPARTGNAKMDHLTKALDVDRQALRRVCERARPGRRAAAPLFWTMGGQQVGKAALSGWKEILAPAIRDRNLDAVIWPFSGRLEQLLQPGRVIIAETYPAEVYRHLDIQFIRRGAGQKSGKRSQPDRAINAKALRNWSKIAQVELTPDLIQDLQNGFGSSPTGEDRFDAIVGLFGMLNVLLGYRPSGEPEDRTIRRVEGWILGQID